MSGGTHRPSPAPRNCRAVASMGFCDDSSLVTAGVGTSVVETFPLMASEETPETQW